MGAILLSGSNNIFVKIHLTEKNSKVSFRNFTWPTLTPGATSPGKVKTSDDTHPWVGDLSQVLLFRLLPLSDFTSASVGSSITSLVSNIWCSRWLRTLMMMSTVVTSRAYDVQTNAFSGEVCKVKKTFLEYLIAINNSLGHSVQKKVNQFRQCIKYLWKNISEMCAILRFLSQNFTRTQSWTGTLSSFIAPLSSFKLFIHISLIIISLHFTDQFQISVMDNTRDQYSLVKINCNARLSSENSL